VEAELRARWRRDAGDSSAAEEVLQGLLGRYREPHRRYHGLAHVVRVLRSVDELSGRTGVADAAALRWAAWYHDAVYDPRAGAGHNETASGALARRDLDALGRPDGQIETVVRLVLATATHHPRDADEAVLCDADLAVLASDPATYAAYAAGVRAEYGHLDDAAWRAGRAAVLEALAAGALFHVPPVEERQARARANLAAELATLR
jgi:predicted metal-dependent HD superfamily phosphohydrolase